MISVKHDNKLPDPTTTVLNYVSPGLEDAVLTSTDISASSTFLKGPNTFTNMSQQTITGIFRGAYTFEGLVSYDIPTLGDRISWIAVEIDLNSWFPEYVLHFLERQQYVYADPSGSWSWANSLGSTIIERVWLQAGDIQLDGFPGEWIDVWARLFLKPDISTFILRDCLGSLPPQEYQSFRPGDFFPTESRGKLIIPIPTWCLRQRHGGSIPLGAMKEGTLTLYVKFRPFAQCVRSQSGAKPGGCADTPGGKIFTFYDVRYPFNNERFVTVPPISPIFKSCRALVNYAFVDGLERHTLLHEAFADLIQPVQTFHFEAPLRFQVSATADHVLVNLPLECAHPVDELIWFLRRTAVRDNSDWTNYSAQLDICGNVQRTPMLRSATIQVESANWITENEVYYRSSYAGNHSGIQIASDSFIYHYAFTERPEEFQPRSSVNATEVSMRLMLDVRQPGTIGDTNRGWEVFVFVLYRNWMRYQNGMAAPIFEGP